MIDSKGKKLEKGMRVKAFGKIVGYITHFETEERVYVVGQGTKEALDTAGTFYAEELTIAQERTRA